MDGPFTGYAVDPDIDIIRRIKFAPIREQLEFSVGGRLPDADLIQANLNSEIV